MKAHKKMVFLLIFLLLHTSCSTGEICVLRPAEPVESEYFSRDEAISAENTVETVEEETVAETIVKESSEISTRYQTAYEETLRFFLDDVQTENPDQIQKFGFAYLDNDNIPELIYSAEPAGFTLENMLEVFSYVNDSVISYGMIKGEILQYTEYENSFSCYDPSTGAGSKTRVLELNTYQITNNCTVLINNYAYCNIGAVQYNPQTKQYDYLGTIENYWITDGSNNITTEVTAEEFSRSIEQISGMNKQVIFYDLTYENIEKLYTDELYSSAASSYDFWNMYENYYGSDDTDENYIYLQAILETKTYENSMKEVILAAYEDLYQNYDKAYAYKKIPKAKYLKMFCDAIKDHLEVAELVEEHDADEPYAELLESKDALGITKDDTIYLRVDSVDRVTANMVHEVWHLKNQCHKVLVADNAIDISVDVREGLSAWQEKFVEPLQEKEIIVRNIDEDRTININIEIIQHNYAEYTASYPGYKNNTARLIALLGMENYIEIVHSEHDYIISMREKLCAEFEQEKVDEFLINYVISTIFFDKNNIVVMDRLQDRYDSVRLNITENEDLLKCTSEEDFLAMWDENIKREEEKISSYQDILEEYKNLDMSTEYITSTIKTLENSIYVYRNTVHVRKDLLENYSYESMREIIEFDIKADQAKLKVFEDCLQDEEETIWKAVIALENSFNTLMVDRINHTRNPEEFNELTENCDNYNRCVRIRCYEGEEDVTSDNFEKTVGRAIKKRPAFQTD